MHKNGKAVKSYEFGVFTLTQVWCIMYVTGYCQLASLCLLRTAPVWDPVRESRGALHLRPEIKML